MLCCAPTQTKVRFLLLSFFYFINNGAPTRLMAWIRPCWKLFELEGRKAHGCSSFGLEAVSPMGTPENPPPCTYFHPCAHVGLTKRWSRYFQSLLSPFRLSLVWCETLKLNYLSFGESLALVFLSYKQKIFEI